MHALDIKLLRDFKRLWVQAVAIAMVLACGVAILLTSVGMYNALSETRTAYYERNRFADIFAQAKRAPLSLLAEISRIDGVMSVEARITGAATLDIPGRTRTAVGRILSYPEDSDPLLNLPFLVKGRFPNPISTKEIVVNEPFAIANGFKLGDSFSANLRGQKRSLTIVGTALSPEFVYTIGPGALMPDNESFGIIWMPERAAAAAFDMTGAFNDVAIAVASGMTTAPVIDALDTLLEPFGGLGAYDRTAQQSDAFLDAELKQLKGMAAILPPIFFLISGFLVSMVMSRIITLERSEIGLLKAIGYSDIEICLHYLMLAALIAVVGVGVGWVAGTVLAQSLAGQYARFFDFPFLIFRVSYWVYAAAGLAALLTTSLGATQAALKAARLAPAIAMQPPAPPRFKRSFIDDALARMRLSQSTVMILRSLLRWPLRSFLTSLGLALAVASVVSSTFINDALTEIIDMAFYQTNRQDAMLLFTDDLPEAVLEDVRHLPGVLQAESQQFHAAILHNGHLTKRVAVESRRPGNDLSRVLDADGKPLDVPANGVVLSKRLATQLDLRPGEKVDIEFLTGRRETFSVTVTALVEQHFGLGAYMNLENLNALFRQAPRVSTVNITLDTDQSDALHVAVKNTPHIAGIIEMNENRRSFEHTIEENIVVMNTIYIVVAMLITIGVTYNAARIQLSERARELASLRILGFGRGEVSYILVGEMMLIALVAQPFGWLIGAGIAQLMTSAFTSDLYAIPLVLKPATFAFASLVVLGAAFASVMIVRRRLDRLDLVSVMKTREYKMAHSTRTIVLIGIGVTLVAGLYYFSFRTDPVAVDLATVTRGPLEVTINADGKTQVRDLFEVASPIAGTAMRSPVDEGDIVRKGETVVAVVRPSSAGLLDARAQLQAEAALQEATAARLVAQADLKQAEETAHFAQSQFERTQALVTRGVVSVTQLEDATQSLAVANATIEAAQARIEMADGAIEQARASLLPPDDRDATPDSCCVQLTAPAYGVVLSVAAISERPVSIGTPLVGIGDPGQLELVADILSNDAVRLKPGALAYVERWGGDEVLEAKLDRIDPKARTKISALGIEEQRVDAYFELVSPIESRPSLGDGFSVFLRIVEWRAEDVLQIPLSAAFRNDTGWAVFVALDGVAEKRAVTLGRRNDRMVEVIQGLEFSEHVVTHPSDAIAAGVALVERSQL